MRLWLSKIATRFLRFLNRMFGTKIPPENLAPNVTVDQIRELQLNDPDQTRFIIVDVRSEAESNVSVIPGAITKSEFETNRDQHRDKQVIAYCTVGVRSGNFAAMLNKDGWDAHNYLGSILDWCDNGLPLTTSDGTATTRVHTYSKCFSVPKEYDAVQNDNTV